MKCWCHFVSFLTVSSELLKYPEVGSEELKSGIPRNFQIFKPLDFLAEVTQHIPNKGEHQIRHYGWYSNKKRGCRAKQEGVKAGKKPDVPDLSMKRRQTWAMLIKLVYEVDPFICPKCNGTMKVVSFITEADVVRKILVNDGLWQESAVRPPPLVTTPPTEPRPQPEDFGDMIPDYTVCEDSCPED